MRSPSPRLRKMRARRQPRRRRASTSAVGCSSSRTRSRNDDSGRPASVVPASPTNTSSDARFSVHTDSVDCRCGIATVRTPNFRAVRTDERRDAIDWLACRRIARDGRTASVVAMEAKPGVGVQLGAAERTDDEAALRTDQTGAGDAAVRRVARGHIETVAVYPNARQRSKPWHPGDFVLNVSARRSSGFTESCRTASSRRRASV